MELITLRGGLVLTKAITTGTNSMILESDIPLEQEVANGVWKTDWSKNGPTIWPSVRNTAIRDNIYDFKTIEWFYDGTLISADDSRFDITGTTLVGTTQQVKCLKIKANLDMETSKRITCRLVTDINGADETLSSDTVVSKRVVSAATYTGYIKAENGNNSINSDGKNNIILEGVLKLGGDELAASAFTIDWYKAVITDEDGVDDGMTLIPSKGNSNPITLEKDEIGLSEVIIAVFKVAGKEEFRANCTVFDRSDPYEISAVNVPEVLRNESEMKTTLSVVGIDGSPVTAFNQFAFRLREYKDGPTIKTQEKSEKNFFITAAGDFRKYKKIWLEYEISRNA